MRTNMENGYRQLISLIYSISPLAVLTFNGNRLFKCHIKSALWLHEFFSTCLPVLFSSNFFNIFFLSLSFVCDDNMCVTCVHAFTCVLAGMYIPPYIHGGHRTTLGVVPQLPPCLRQSLLLFAIAQARLAGPWLLWLLSTLPPISPQEHWNYTLYISITHCPVVTINNTLTRHLSNLPTRNPESLLSLVYEEGN